MKCILNNSIHYGLRLNVKKCVLLSITVEWCGRLINNQGWKYQPSYYQKILRIPCPETVGELEAVVYMVTWLNIAIPKAAELKDHLLELIKEIKRGLSKGRRRPPWRKARAKISLRPWWSSQLTEQYELLKEMVRKSCEKRLASYDPDLPMEIYTDASDE